MKVLCFDVGGTNIKYAIYENGKRLLLDSMPTRVTTTNNYILEDILKKIEEFNYVDYIGVSTAGVVNSEKGEVVFAGPTIPNYTGTKIKEEIEKKYNIKCYVENDVNSAAYGEYVFSKLTGDTFCLTIGTGLGGAIIINNKIYSGYSMTAGEIGYINYKNKSIQEFASTKSLLEEAKKKLGYEISGKELFDLARSQNIIANSVIDDFIDSLIVAILNVTYIMNPKNIIIGGAITGQGSYLEEKIINKFNDKIINKQFKTNISLANLKNEAGLYGIYCLIKERNKNV